MVCLFKRQTQPQNKDAGVLLTGFNRASVVRVCVCLHSTRVQRVLVARLLKKPVGQVTACDLVAPSASQKADSSGENRCRTRTKTKRQRNQEAQ